PSAGRPSSTRSGVRPRHPSVGVDRTSSALATRAGDRSPRRRHDRAGSAEARSGSRPRPTALSRGSASRAGTGSLSALGANRDRFGVVGKIAAEGLAAAVSAGTAAPADRPQAETVGDPPGTAEAPARTSVGNGRATATTRRTRTAAGEDPGRSRRSGHDAPPYRWRLGEGRDLGAKGDPVRPA